MLIRSKGREVVLKELESEMRKRGLLHECLRSAFEIVCDLIGNTQNNAIIKQ